MVARIVAVLTQKGGAGKTTISYQLSESLQRRGFKVLLVDADPQNSSVGVRGKLLEDHSGLAVMSLAQAGGKLVPMLKPFLDSFDIIVVDGPPSHTAPQTRAAASLADLTLIPFSPGATDLESTVATSIAIQEVYEGRQDGPPPTFIVVNKYKQTNIAALMVDSISAKTGFPMFEARLHHRVSFDEANLTGLSVDESKDVAAKDELAALVDEVLGKLQLQNFSAEIA